jgi:hypothetical protein
MIVSTMPSAKSSFSCSPLILVTGRTAIDGLNLDDPSEGAWTMLPSKSPDFRVNRNAERVAG